MIRNANKRVSVVALARFRCRFCTKSLLSLLLRRTCTRFRDRCITTVLFIRSRYGNHGREMCAEPTAGEPRGRTRLARGVPRRRRGSLTLRATSRQLRGACGSPAVRRECAKTENAARMSACGPRSSFEVCVSDRNSTQNPITDALRRMSNAS